MADGFSITARDGKKETAGTITLTFTDAPLALAGWTVTDAQSRPTRVQLVGLQRAAGPRQVAVRAEGSTPEERRTRQGLSSATVAEFNTRKLIARKTFDKLSQRDDIATTSSARPIVRTKPVPELYPLPAAA